MSNRSGSNPFLGMLLILVVPTLLMLSPALIVGRFLGDEAGLHTLLTESGIVLVCSPKIYSAIAKWCWEK